MTDSVTPSDETRPLVVSDVTQERIDNLLGLVGCLDRLLSCYRTGGQPSGALLDRLAEARRREASLSGRGG